jgi:hypothetical protein
MSAGRFALSAPRHLSCGRGRPLNFEFLKRKKTSVNTFKLILFHSRPAAVSSAKQSKFSTAVWPPFLKHVHLSWRRRQQPPIHASGGLRRRTGPPAEASCFWDGRHQRRRRISRRYTSPLLATSATKTIHASGGLRRQWNTITTQRRPPASGIVRHRPPARIRLNNQLAGLRRFHFDGGCYFSAVNTCKQ